MEQFKPAFTEDDISILWAPSQASLDELYLRIKSHAVNEEEGELWGSGLVDDANFGILSYEVRVHPFPVMDHNRYRHCASFTTKKCLDGETPNAAYTLWYKDDRQADNGIYFELRGSEPCTTDDVNRLLAFLAPAEA